MSSLTLSMKMSPKDTGRLFSKACRLEDENKQLRARVTELELSAQRSPAEIVNQTLEIAEALYALRGYIAPLGHLFYESTHPHELEAWRAACVVQEMLTNTSPEDALSDIEDCAEKPIEQE